MFDFNRDGKIDRKEFTLGMDILNDDAENNIEDDFDEDLELDLAGLDRYELDDMDEFEREEALVEAGLDPDDFDF